jgi:predicted ATPase
MPEPVADRFKAVLVEGIPGVGKSTLIDALIRRHVSSAETRKIRTLVHLAQTYTYGPLAPGEDACTLTVADNLQLLERIVQTIEWLHADLRHSDRPCFVLIDTLHLTHCLRPGVLPWEEAVSIDRRLAAANCKLLLLRGIRETIWSRCIQARASWEFLEYARKFGRTDEELHLHFVAEQAQLASMFDKSAMSKTSIQNDGELQDVMEEAYEFWQR